ncbi:MAG: hypothetical protein ACP5I3_12070 [Thermoproteus sp.]
MHGFALNVERRGPFLDLYLLPGGGNTWVKIMYGNFDPDVDETFARALQIAETQLVLGRGRNETYISDQFSEDDGIAFIGSFRSLKIELSIGRSVLMIDKKEYATGKWRNASLRTNSDFPAGFFKRQFGDEAFDKNRVLLLQLPAAVL